MLCQIKTTIEESYYTELGQVVYLENLK